jgi:hypothetical protein
MSQNLETGKHKRGHCIEWNVLDLCFFVVGRNEYVCEQSFVFLFR